MHYPFQNCLYTYHSARIAIWLLSALFSSLLIMRHFIDNNNTMENDWIICLVVIRKSFYSFSLCVLLVIVCLNSVELTTIYRLVIRFGESKNQISAMFFRWWHVCGVCNVFIVTTIADAAVVTNLRFYAMFYILNDRNRMLVYLQFLAQHKQNKRAFVPVLNYISCI